MKTPMTDIVTDIADLLDRPAHWEAIDRWGDGEPDDTPFQAAEEIRTLRTRLSQWEKVAEEMAGALERIKQPPNHCVSCVHKGGLATSALTTYRNLKGQSDD